MKTIATTILMVAIVAAIATSAPSSQSGESSHTVTQADIDRWKVELSNWGRWGKDDEKGTLNLITPHKRRQAADLVRDGVTISLARPANTEKAVVLVALGMNVFDNCDLDALAEAAASRKRWEFLLTAAPLPMVKGTGSPINPIALF